MGWLRLVGSFNYRSLLQNIVSLIGLFFKKRALLQRKPIILKSLLIVATQYEVELVFVFSVRSGVMTILSGGNDQEAPSMAQSPLQKSPQ